MMVLFVIHPLGKFTLDQIFFKVIRNADRLALICKGKPIVWL